jgi:hypothetical protein
MKQRSHLHSRLLAAAFMLLSVCSVFAENKSDSLVPKHYIKSSLYTSYTFFPERKVKNSESQYLQYADFSAGACVPLITKSSWADGGSRLKTTHLLFTGSYSWNRFSSAFVSEPRNLVRSNIGLRLIHNDGKGNSLFFSFNPYFARDRFSSFIASRRFAFMLVYNRTVSERFSFRAGVWRTYIFGRRSTLPLLGVRIGRLDGLNFNLQFPRNISLNYPIHRMLTLSLISRPVGTLYAFRNDDSRYTEKGSTIYLGTRDVISGLQVTLLPFHNFVLYGSSGLARGTITRAERINTFGLRSVNYEFSKFNLSDAPYFNIGLVWYLGKARNSSGNSQMYDVIDMNNSFGHDDNNTMLPNAQIPALDKASQNLGLQYKDIEDLINVSDIE